MILDRVVRACQDASLRVEALWGLWLRRESMSELSYHESWLLSRAYRKQSPRRHISLA